jgi:hypothetical protein
VDVAADVAADVLVAVWSYDVLGCGMLNWLVGAAVCGQRCGCILDY